MSKKDNDSEAEQTAAYNKAMGINSNTKGITDKNIKNPGLTSDDQVELKKEDERITPLNKLKSLSITNRVEEMKDKLVNEYHVFEGLALGGDVTLFFAWPSTGKTLLFMHLLIDGIKRGVVDPEDVYYINADDNYRGLVTKAEIAKEYGFHMISPHTSNISSSETIQTLIDIVNEESHSQMIVILDTLKKFVDLMSKTVQSAFYEQLRMLTAKGVTVIIAGHANKYADKEGELIYEGTADSRNDTDCVYSINCLSPLDSDEMTVEFRNCKSSGGVLQTRSFKYNNRKDISWTDRLASVEPLDENAAGLAKYKKDRQDKKEKYASQLLFVSALLKTRSMNQSEIMKEYHDHKQNPESDLHPLASEISVRELQTGLKKLTNIAWRVTRDTRHNAKVFTLIDADGSQYRKAKDGE